MGSLEVVGYGYSSFLGHQGIDGLLVFLLGWI